MCHDSGTSFRAAGSRKAPPCKKVWEENGKCWTDDPFTHLLLLCTHVWALACTGFFHPLCWSPPSGAGLAEPLRGSTSSKAQTRMLERPSGGPGRMGLARNRAPSPERVASPALITLSMWKRSTLKRRGGTNQTNLLPHGRKGQSVTKALLLWGGMLWSGPLQAEPA